MTIKFQIGVLTVCIILLLFIAFYPISEKLLKKNKFIDCNKINIWLVTNILTFGVLLIILEALKYFTATR